MGKRRRWNRDKGRRGKKIVLDVAEAQEVVDLIEDQPGTADEAILDRALDAVENPAERVPAEAQDLIAEGRAVALEVPPDAAAAVETLIREDQVVEKRLLRRTAERLRGKLQRAAHKRRSWRRH